MNRLLRRLVLLSLVLSSVVPASLSAAEVGGLYEAVLPVSGQSSGERSRAVAEGFRQVLVKVSGQRSILALPALQPELKRGESLLGSFRYETAPSRVPGQVVDPQLTGTRIRLQFDPVSVRAVLNRAGAPVWGANRQPVHLWVVRGEGPGSTLLTLGAPQVDTLIDAAAQRGLSPVLPSSGDLTPPADARVAVLATLVPGRAHINGMLRIDGASEPLEVSAADEFAALRELVAQAADRLGGRYAVTAHADQVRLVRLQVSGVARLESYAALERWLAGLPLVRDVTLEKVAGDRAVFLLALAGEPARLTQAMMADGRFSQIGAPELDSASLYSLDATLANSSAP